jgi:hypothetical protein
MAREKELAAQKMREKQAAGKVHPLSGASRPDADPPCFVVSADAKKQSEGASKK